MVCKCSLVEQLDLLPIAVLLMIGGKLPAQRAQFAQFVGHLPFALPNSSLAPPRNTPGEPGGPAAASPTSPSQSGIDCGRTPNFSTTPASSMSISRRRSQLTMRLPETSWARSLSGEQITICSTPASFLKRAVALDRASSASNSTIDQTTSPSAETASSASGNWAIRLVSTPAPVL